MLKVRRARERHFALSEAVDPEIRRALRDWRSHMGHGAELYEPFDPQRDHVCGDRHAPVVVLEYGDLGSVTESREDRAIYDKLQVALDGGKICLAFRHFPIVDSHPGAWLAAQALEAADRQGRFWELHGALLEAVVPWAKPLSKSGILEAARSLGLDVERLQGDMDDSSTTTKILRDLHGGFRSGVNGAPTYYVQGIRQDIENADELLERIEHALSGDRAALWPPSHTHAVDKRHAARLWHEGLRSGELAAAMEHWHEDIEWRGWSDELPGGGHATGRQAVEGLHGRPRAAAAEFQAQARDFIENGDRLVVVGEAEGGTAEDAWCLPYVQIWDFESGKVRRVATLTDARWPSSARSPASR